MEHHGSPPIGGAVFEVTQPRVTCYRVGIRVNEPRMPALLTSSGRPGFYFRVLQDGEVGVGDDANTGPLVSFSRSGIAAHWNASTYQSILQLAEACDVPSSICDDDAKNVTTLPA